MNGCFCLHVCLYIMCMHCPWRPELELETSVKGFNDMGFPVLVPNSEIQYENAISTMSPGVSSPARVTICLCCWWKFSPKQWSWVLENPASIAVV